MITAFKKGVDSVAESFFVCCDSNYNQPATQTKRTSQNTTFCKACWKKMK